MTHPALSSPHLVSHTDIVTVCWKHVGFCCLGELLARDAWIGGDSVSHMVGHGALFPRMLKATPHRSVCRTDAALDLASIVERVLIFRSVLVVLVAGAPGVETCSSRMSGRSAEGCFPTRVPPRNRCLRFVLVSCSNIDSPTNSRINSHGTSLVVYITRSTINNSGMCYY